MANATVEFKISIADYDKDAAAELRKAREIVDSIERKIINSFRTSERFKAMGDISGQHEAGGKRMMVPPRIKEDYIEAQTIVDVADPAPKAPAYFNITEKTANILLNGKLLTGDQKKALVKRMGFDLDAE